MLQTQGQTLVRLFLGLINSMRGSVLLVVVEVELVFQRNSNKSTSN